MQSLQQSFQKKELGQRERERDKRHIFKNASYLETWNIKYHIKIHELWMEESSVSQHLCIYIFTLAIYAFIMDTLLS